MVARSVSRDVGLLRNPVGRVGLGTCNGGCAHVGEGALVLFPDEALSRKSTSSGVMINFGDLTTANRTTEEMGMTWRNELYSDVGGRGKCISSPPVEF
jgi:hypothetical protein